MARAVLVNASIHPTLTLSRNERKLGLEQLLHGFGGSGLRDQLNGKKRKWDKILFRIFVCLCGGGFTESLECLVLRVRVKNR